MNWQFFFVCSNFSLYVAYIKLGNWEYFENYRILLFCKTWRHIFKSISSRITNRTRYQILFAVNTYSDPCWWFLFTVRVCTWMFLCVVNLCACKIYSNDYCRPERNEKEKILERIARKFPSIRKKKTFYLMLVYSLFIRLLGSFMLPTRQAS